MQKCRNAEMQKCRNAGMRTQSPSTAVRRAAGLDDDCRENRRQLTRFRDVFGHDVGIEKTLLAYISAQIASASSLVVAWPPRSGVRFFPDATTRSIAPMMRS